MKNIARQQLCEKESLLPRRCDLYYIPPNLTLTTTSALSESEQMRANQYKVAWKTRQYQQAKQLTREVLAGYLAVSPGAICFDSNRYGKPYLSPKPSSPLHFNLSHSKNCSLIGVYEDPVGIDIETIHREMDIFEFAQHHFHPDEIELVQQNPVNFFRVFTRKEAILKAVGRGLIDDLASFNTAQDHVLVDTSLSQVSNWFCQTFAINDDIICTVATSNPNTTLNLMSIVE